ncbi:hypothetical protein OCU04_009679 [Sclerotinia nivalis]|uniref:Uncharacterized protein n=1 Tax=Sclerotinia nivalis TaxID=352851 RepID=A0A9X0DGS2_9HELO|nr:hypothetical protein OCU04_009679 [Sclerotinia nivalis]
MKTGIFIIFGFHSFQKGLGQKRLCKAKALRRPAAQAAATAGPPAPPAAPTATLRDADARPKRLVLGPAQAQSELPYNYHLLPPFTWTPWEHGKVNEDQYGTLWYDPKPATVKGDDGTQRPKLDKKIYSKNTDKVPGSKAPPLPLYSDSTVQTAPWK